MPDISRFPNKRMAIEGNISNIASVLAEKISILYRNFSLFARHGRALTGASPEHAQVVGNV